tara:strand:+ start:1332 stop:1955 length:624 start_codon:yes stop_codon:yes gene_type:complete
MRHNLTYRLEKPSEKKWQIYKSLIPTIDEICIKHRLVVEKRTCHENRFEFDVTLIAIDECNLHDATREVVELLTSKGIKNKLVYSSSIQRPTMQMVECTWTLASGYNTPKNWEKWLKIMPDLDSLAGEYDIRCKRIIDPINYSCHITNHFTDLTSFTKLVYFTSQMCIMNGLNVEPLDEYKISEVALADILSELKSVTKNHKQLNLF